MLVTVAFTKRGLLVSRSLTIVVDPRVFNLVDFVPTVGAAFTRKQNRRVSIVVVLELCFKVEGNHGWFALVVDCTFNAQVYYEPGNTQSRVSFESVNCKSS